MEYSETPKSGHANSGPIKSRTSKFPEFCEMLHTITCVIHFSDQQSPGILVKLKVTVSRRSGVGNFTVHGYVVNCRKKICSLQQIQEGLESQDTTEQEAAVIRGTGSLSQMK